MNKSFLICFAGSQTNDFISKGIVTTRRELLDITENFHNNELSVLFDYENYSKSIDYDPMSACGVLLIEFFTDWLHSLMEGTATITVEVKWKIKDKDVTNKHEIKPKMLLHYIYIFERITDKEVTINGIKV